MKKKATMQETAAVDEVTAKAKTAAPEEKEAPVKARAPKKEKAQNVQPEIFVQYQGSEVAMDALVEAVKKSFREEKKRTPITSLKMYVKPEDGAVYYVINEKFEGKLSI